MQIRGEIKGLRTKLVRPDEGGACLEATLTFTFQLTAPDELGELADIQEAGAVWAEFRAQQMPMPGLKATIDLKGKAGSDTP